MNRKLAVLISLLVFVIASTAQAEETDTIVSPLSSPIIGAHTVSVDPQNVPDYRGVTLRIIKMDWK